jgi:hypothetical protein
MTRLRIAVGLTAMMVALLTLMGGDSRAQIGTIVATPSPVPSPVPTPRPENVTRSFHCNCTTAGRPVLWSGFVQATNYFQARQLAANQCLAYIGEKPASPLIPTPALSFGAAPTFAPLGINLCGQCACS